MSTPEEPTPEMPEPGTEPGPAPEPEPGTESPTGNGGSRK